MWELNIPNNVKNFMWRAVNNILPSMVNLPRRGIDCVTQCQLCRDGL